jgi:hypothetical protein
LVETHLRTRIVKYVFMILYRFAKKKMPKTPG